MKLLKKFASAALLSGSAVIASAATPLLNLINDQAPLVISFNDVPSLVKAWGESPWAKTWSDEQVRKFFAPLHSEVKFEEFDAKLKAETGHTFGELIGFATGDALLAVTSTDIDFESEDGNSVPFIAAIELGGNASKVEKMIEEAREKNPGSPQETEDFAGVTIHTEKSPASANDENKKGPGQVVWAIADGIWLVGFNTQSVIAAVDALKKGGAVGAYGKSERYLVTKEKNGDAHFGIKLWLTQARSDFRTMQHPVTLI